MIATAGNAPTNNKKRCVMNEELSYAEMLEIPVETVTVTHREKRKRSQESDSELRDQVVERVNDRMQETEDPLYAESTPIEREEKPESKKSKRAKRLLFAEFAAICVICAAIFLTNIFLPQSAINTFVRNLFYGQGEAAAADTRTYQDFTLSPIVNEFEEVELAVSETGVLSFTADCAVYAPCEGTLVSVNGDGAARLAGEKRRRLIDGERVGLGKRPPGFHDVVPQFGHPWDILGPEGSYNHRRPHIVIVIVALRAFDDKPKARGGCGGGDSLSPLRQGVHRRRIELRRYRQAGAR